MSIEGVVPGFSTFCVMSRWMANGHVMEYITKNRKANRLELVCLTHWRSDSELTTLQLIGVTRGLNYLHQNKVVHGSLKSVRGVVCYSSRLTSKFPSRMFLSMPMAVSASLTLVYSQSGQPSLRTHTTTSGPATAPLSCLVPMTKNLRASQIYIRCR